jgi:hypothetical protein
MRTKVAILAELHRHKTCSRAQLDRYLRAFNITPIGVRQSPQLFPDDAAERILKQLGFIFPDDCGRPGCPGASKPERLISMSELRNERKRARRAA